jgi:hypothetical protein
VLDREPEEDNNTQTRHAGVGGAALERDLGSMIPEGFPQAAILGGREREGLVSLGSDVVANDHRGRISVHWWW